MADRASVRRRIADLFEKRLHLTVPSEETDLFTSGVMDSLMFVDLLVRLEEEFGIRTTVEDLEIERFRSIARIAEFMLSGNGSDAGAGC
ncbi:MAG: acyl carrier protein [Candidatus Rokubacteria bacterium]|nr:acyl carrier protein [Candidatus Rokubacteria bacterium]